MARGQGYSVMKESNQYYHW